MASPYNVPHQEQCFSQKNNHPVPLFCAKKKVFDYRLLMCTPKYSMFSTISFAIIFFIIYAENTVFKLPIHPIDLRIHELFQDYNTRLPRQKTESTLTAESMPPQLSMQEKTDEVAEEVPNCLYRY